MAGAGPDWTAIITTLLGQALGSAFAPSSFQPRQSFKGTGADPTKTLPEIQATLRGLLSGQIARTEGGVDLPDAHVGAGLPSFSGGGLPMPIGVTGTAASGHEDLTHGFSSAPTSTIDFRHIPVPGDSGDGSGSGGGGPIVSPSLGGGDGGGGGDTSGPGSLLRFNPAGAAADAGAAAGGAPAGYNPSLNLDPQTQGALQLLFHAYASGQDVPLSGGLG